jgi:hypothetical protein
LTGSCPAATLPPIETVFVIVMENQNWSSIKDSTNAPYINALLRMASYFDVVPNTQRSNLVRT